MRHCTNREKALIDLEDVGGVIVWTGDSEGPFAAGWLCRELSEAIEVLTWVEATEQEAESFLRANPLYGAKSEPYLSEVYSSDFRDWLHANR
jgi:hypothetical protein